MSEVITLEKDDKIALITINRPTQLNVLNSEVLIELNEALRQVNNDGDIAAVILTGAGDRAFAAGADIAEMVEMSPAEARTYSQQGQAVLSAIEALNQPVIAAINGFALGGGGELALACDIRIMSDKAKIGFPEVGLGIITGFGGTQRLPRLIGAGRARQMLYTGEIIDADQALAAGLATLKVAPDALGTAARTLALTICEKRTYAVQQTKRCIAGGLESGLAAGLMLETQAFGLCFATHDQKDAMHAFLRSRK